ncbi:MAG: hypothetical protein methR_P1217 [Methyloprofundus sp.]|nr:MAG: hypothetical protein methR_P1217 [Methyloprofundus sp.]
MNTVILLGILIHNEYGRKVKSPVLINIVSEKYKMKNNHSCISIFSHHTDAEQAIKALEKAGFDMKSLSIVGKGYHSDEHPVGYYNTGDRVMFWGKWGALWGGLWGMLFGSAFFWIPGIGPLAMAGPLISTVVGGAEGALAVGGLNALGAALFSIGIPKDSIIKYEESLKADKFLLIVHGNQEDMERARDVLNTIKAEEVEIHNI